MKKVRRYVGVGGASVLAICMNVAPARAERLFLDGHGNSPDRVTIIVQDFAFDSTPVSEVMGPTRLQTIEVTMVYESPTSPYVSIMDMEFKCPNPNHGVTYKKAVREEKKRGGGPPPPPVVSPDPDQVEFRLVRGNQYLKNSVGYKQLNSTDWQTADTYAMKRIYRVACNDTLIAQAKSKAPIIKGEVTENNKTGEYLDMAALRKNLEAIELQYAEYLPSGVFGVYLADLVWEKLWTDAKPPNIDYGPPLTPEQTAALRQKIEGFGKQLDAQRTELEASLKDQKAKLDFTAAAAKFRNNRKWSAGEGMINRMWLSKTEAEVVASIGRPVVTDAGGARYLSYGQSHDNQVFLQNVVTGAIRVNGVFTSCDVRFALIPDSANVFRVADVVVNTTTNINGFDTAGGRSLTNCQELLDRPM